MDDNKREPISCRSLGIYCNIWKYRGDKKGVAGLALEPGTVLWTPSWRIRSYGPEEPAVLLYVALFPHHLEAGCQAVIPLLEARRWTHRAARDGQTLAAFADHPWWAGKAVVVELAAGEPIEAAAALLDSALAGLGLEGPPVIAGAQPYGGASGLIFLRRLVDRESRAERRQRLATLLGT
jgi:hypothetical protein